jgi:hypothetical protein
MLGENTAGDVKGAVMSVFYSLGMKDSWDCFNMSPTFGQRFSGEDASKLHSFPLATQSYSKQAKSKQGRKEGNGLQ